MAYSLSINMTILNTYSMIIKAMSNEYSIIDILKNFAKTSLFSQHVQCTPTNFSSATLSSGTYPYTTASLTTRPYISIFVGRVPRLRFFTLDRQDQRTFPWSVLFVNNFPSFSRKYLNPRQTENNRFIMTWSRGLGLSAQSRILFLSRKVG